MTYLEVVKNIPNTKNLVEIRNYSPPEGNSEVYSKIYLLYDKSLQDYYFKLNWIHEEKCRWCGLSDTRTPLTGKYSTIKEALDAAIADDDHRLFVFDNFIQFIGFLNKYPDGKNIP